MKGFAFILAGFLLFSFQSYSQSQARCSHKGSFEKSMISDTLDAISYTIYLNSFDFPNHEISARTDVELASKVDNLDHSSS